MAAAAGRARVSFTGMSTWQRLRLFNALMALLHLGQGVAILLLSDDTTFPITTSFLVFDEAAGRLVPQDNTVFDLRLAPLVASFVFISAIAHALVTLPGVFEWYVRKLQDTINYVRWWEYAFSASIMICVIAILAGVYDLGSLLLLFAINAVMILTGLITEIHNRPGDRVNWTAFNVGTFAGLVPWLVIGLYLWGPGTEGAGDAPTFVYAIFFSLLGWFALFPLNMWLQYRRVGPWRDYVVGEYGYIVLSLTAKSLLAWQVFAGALTTPGGQ